MSAADIPQDIQRFILSSIDSVPQLEAILLLRSNPNKDWDAKSMSQQLFLTEKRAEEILVNLSDIGLAEATEEGAYHYHPSTEMREIFNRIADCYAKNLIDVTNLIHSKTNRNAQDFGDAFRWRKEEE